MFRKASDCTGATKLLVMACAAFFGQCIFAYSQPVTPPIILPPPIFNPSYPYTVPQPPYKPISPGAAATAFAGSGELALTSEHNHGNPWCLQSSAYDGGQDCSYATLAQCLADRQGLGGFCGQNPRYRPPLRAR